MVAEDEELEDVAIGAAGAAVTFEGLLALVHGEGRRFFIMEWAVGFVNGAAALEVNAFEFQDGHDVGGVADLVFDVIRDAHGKK